MSSRSAIHGAAKILRTLFPVAGALLVVACGLSTPQVVDVAAPQVPSRNFPLRLRITTEYLVPDSVAWSYSGATGGETIEKSDDGDFLSTIHLGKDLGSDTVSVDLFTLGLRTTMLRCVRSESDSFLDVVDVQGDAPSRNALRSFASRKGFRWTAQALTNSIASGLLDGDSTLALFPLSLPAGVSADTLRKVALVEASKRNLSIRAQAERWLLDLDSTAASDRIRTLVQEKAIDYRDTSVLFPQAPLRLAVPFLLAPSLVTIGQGASSLSGAIAADSGLLGIQYRVLSASDSSDRTKQFVLDAGTPVPGQVTAWVVDSSRARLGAGSGVAPGNYLLELRTLGRFAGRFLTPFSVAPPPDLQGPTINHVGPSKDTVLQDTANKPVTVTYAFADTSGVDSIWIQGQLAGVGATVISGPATVPPTGIPTRIVVRAKDRRGNFATDSSLRITRPLAVFPTLLYGGRTYPARGLDTFATGQISDSLRWVFRRASSTVASSQAFLEIGSASIPLASQKANDSTWRVDVPLPPDGKAYTVRILATDTGKRTMQVDTVQFVRRRDTAKPTVAVVARAWTVAYGTTSAQVHWTVSDNHKLDSVHINGQRVFPTVVADQETYWIQASLAVGSNPFVVEAWDSLGNLGRDSQNVQRKHNVLPPVIKRSKTTFDRFVPYASTSTVHLAWSVDAVESLDSVTINGVKAPSSSITVFEDVYSIDLPVGIGVTTATIKAYDHWVAQPSSDVVTIRSVVVDDELNEYQVRKLPDGHLWMASNLRMSPSFGNAECAQGDCTAKGRLYSWAQAFKLASTYDLTRYQKTPSEALIRGLCPKGWHVASRTDWNKLFKAIKPATNDSTATLRGGKDWISVSHTDGSGYDTTGFGGTDLHAGFLVPTETIEQAIGTGWTRSASLSYWTQTETAPGSAFRLTIDAGSPGGASPVAQVSPKPQPAAVRCVDDGI